MVSRKTLLSNLPCSGVIASPSKLRTVNSVVRFDESLLNNGAATARTTGGFCQKVVCGRTIASGDFIDDPIKGKLRFTIAGLARRDCILCTPDCCGTQSQDFKVHIRVLSTGRKCAGSHAPPVFS